MTQFLAISLYVAILFCIGFASVRRHQSSSSYLIGDRGLNFWLTALAAHASDMSTWLFMGFPALAYANGLFSIWTAAGLIVFMYLNWQFFAPRIRRKTEEYGSLTFSSFFESRFHDTSGLIRIFTALMSLVFFLFYISAGLYGLGIVINQLFAIPYQLGITIGVAIMIPYLFYGGYTTLAWIDLFQGLFLLVVIVAVPLFALQKVPSISLSSLPTSSLDIFYAFFGWGLGYFGQPHIATKFMGIKRPEEIPKSMAVGMSWQVLVLSAAILVGLVAVPFFTSVGNPELIFVRLVDNLFVPFIASFVLCAILAATISTMDSQILVLATSLTEDFYKRVFHKEASSKQLVRVSRSCIVLVAAAAYLIASSTTSSIYHLVLYAWSGLGASFGPVMLFALFSKKTTRQGAWAGILVGGAISGAWPLIKHFIAPDMPALIPGFACSCLAIYLTSLATNRKIVRY